MNIPEIQKAQRSSGCLSPFRAQYAYVSSLISEPGNQATDAQMTSQSQTLPLTRSFFSLFLVKCKAETGFSLIEVMMCLTFLALIMLPFTLMMTSTGQVARGIYLQSTRSMLLNSLKSELAPSDPNFAVNYTDIAMNTGVSDSGQILPYMRAVDITTSGATTSMKRTTGIYLYTNTTDATSAPLYYTNYIQYPKTIRVRAGSIGTGLIDTLNRYWWGDTNLYNSGNKIPGLTATYSTNANGADVINTTGTDDGLFQWNRYNNPINFNADVENGAYTVKLYFCETYGGINATSGRRVFDIYLEGYKMNTDGPYSPYESTGGNMRADIRMYDVNVTDGVLNVQLSLNSASNNPNAFLTAIEIRKRTQS